MFKKRIGYLSILFGLGMVAVLTTVLATSPIRQVVSHRQFTQERPALTPQQEEVVAAYNDQVAVSDSATDDPFAETGKGKAITGLEEVTEDGVFAYLRVPDIGITQPIRLGANEENLARGAAQVAGTPLPIGGVGNRSVIAGHRSWYSDLMFFRLNELKAGQLIYIDLPGKTLTYQITDLDLMPAEDWEQLTPIDGKDMLTLLTCDPLYPPFYYRLLVNAERLPDTVLTTHPRSLTVDVLTTVSYEPLTYLVALIWLLFAWVSYRFFIFLRNSRAAKQV